MRINKFIAQHSGLSRREVDEAIMKGRITVNGEVARLGQQIHSTDIVALNGHTLAQQLRVYVVLHKPVGYVCSRNGQGAPTIYDLLPSRFAALKPAGRLDKDSSGVVLLTNDGDFANMMTHPRYEKIKEYQVTLSALLTPEAVTSISHGVPLDDGVSHLQLEPLGEKTYLVRMSGGRNRQIRRTFAAIGYIVIKLHRTRFGEYTLEGIPSGRYIEVHPIR